MQEEGGYDVTMPEPLAFVSGDGYKLRISEVGSGRVECSDDFYLMSTEDSLLPGEPGPATIDVLSPTKEDVAVAGEEYTVEVRTAAPRHARGTDSASTDSGTINRIF